MSSSEQLRNALRTLLGALGKRPYLAMTLAYSLLLLVIYKRVWWGGDDGRWFFGWDCLREYWPDISFGKHALRDGEIPSWNPYALGGYSFFGDSQAGLLAPVNWLLWGLGSLFGDGPWMIQAKVLVNLCIGLTGMHALILRRTPSHAAAAIAAVVYVFGSPLLVHKNGAFLWPFLYLPWAVVALERYLDSPTARRGALLAAAIWLCGSAGHPQGFFYDLVILGSYWAYRTCETPKTIGPSLRRQWRGGAAAALVTGLLVLPIYLPSADAVALSPRANRGPDYVMQGPLTPQGLTELLWPNLDTNWQLDIYVGPLALVLALLALVAAHKGVERRRRIFWAVVAVFGVLLAMGKHTPVLPFFYDHVPGFTLFRIAYRHKLIFGFAIAVLAGEGAGVLLRSEAARSRRWALSGAIGLWLAMALLARFGVLGIVGAGKPAAAVTAAILWGGTSLLVAGLALWDRKRAPYYLVAMAALVTVDLWRAGGSKLDIMQRPPRLEDDAAVLSRMDGLRDTWRYWNDGVLPFHPPYQYEVRELSGFSNPVILERHEKVMKQVARTPALLPKLNVRYWVRKGPPPRSLQMLERGGKVWEFPNPTPILRAYPGVLDVPAEGALLQMTRPEELTAALVDPADAPGELPRGQGTPIDGTVVSFQRNRVVLDIESPVPAVAVINEPFFPGWEAEVNGEPTELFRANYYLRAVVIPSGKSRIELSFRPRGQRTLLVGFALGLLLCGLALFGRFAWLDRAPRPFSP